MDVIETAAGPTLRSLADEARLNGYVLTLTILPDGRFIKVLSPELLADNPKAAGAFVATEWNRFLTGPPSEPENHQPDRLTHDERHQQAP